MPIALTTRKLEAFALHATNDGAAADYKVLFEGIASVPPIERVLERAEKLIAIPELTTTGDQIAFTAYEGPLGTKPLIFNKSDAAERIGDLSAGEVLATKTHGRIDLRRRIAVIEFNQRGAKAQDIAQIFENLGRLDPKQSQLAVELNPIATSKFLDELARFKRIRMADIRVARPNPDWGEHYDFLIGAAQESDGQTIDLAVTAGRGLSLSTQGGIVQWIKNLAAIALSPLKNARVVGTRDQEENETAISLARYQEHRRVKTKLTPDGHVDDTDIRTKINAYLDQLIDRHGS